MFSLHDAHPIYEDLWSEGADLSYKFSPSYTLTTDTAFSDTKRTSSRYELHFDATNLPIDAQQMRPDYLLSDAAIQLYDMTLLDFSGNRSEEHTSELQSLMRNSYAVFCLKKKKEYHPTNRFKHRNIYVILTRTI